MRGHKLRFSPLVGVASSHDLIHCRGWKPLLQKRKAWPLKVYRKLYVDFAEREKLREELNRNGYVQDHEIKLRKKDGTEMDCLLSTTVRKDVDGTLLGYQCIVRDITRRKQMELALQKRGLREFA